MKNTPFVGKVIRRLRLSLRMTQEDLCAATDYRLSAAYLSKLERVPVNFSWAIFEEICDVLSVEASDVIKEAKSGDLAELQTGVRESGKDYIAAPQNRSVDVVDMNNQKTGKSVTIPARCAAGSYGYHIDMITMESDRGGYSYYRNGVAIISPVKDAKPGDDCLFNVDGIMILGRYEFDGRHHWITYLNRMYPPEALNSKDQILGLVTGFIWLSDDSL
jgi:transcriptional regulator with XRE-family HTH domain